MKLEYTIYKIGADPLNDNSIVESQQDIVVLTLESFKWLVQNLHNQNGPSYNPFSEEVQETLTPVIIELNDLER